jgi:hypothetical protein
MEIRLTDCVSNEEVLHRLQEERNILHPIKGRKVNWFGHSLRRNCLLQHIIEENIEERSDGTTSKKR